MLRLLFLGLLGCAVLVGCGASTSSRPARAPGTVAVVGTTAISQSQIQEYMNYALRFYSWVDISSSGDRPTACTVRAETTACGTLRKQVVRRVLEERVVTEYAAHHGVRLSASDARRIEREMKRLQSPHSGTQRLFSTERVSPHFMRGVLQNQLLVRLVEAAVVGKAALVGPSFRLRKYVFGIDSRSYKSAIDFATGGVIDAASHRAPIHWVATYRLPVHVRSLAGVASDGDFVGPTLVGPAYVVYQVLGHGIHRYGLPAREETEARIFRAWLDKRMSRIAPKCFQGPFKTVSCSRLYH